MAEKQQGPRPASTREILEQSFLASPKNYLKNQWNPSPLEDAFGQSAALDYLRQVLPANAGETKLGKKAAELIPAGPGPESLREKARRALLATPLGGYSADKTQEFEVERLASDETRRGTVRAGFVPTEGLTGEVESPSMRATAAQAGGVLLNDVVTDGARNIWWFLNAPQAIGSLAALTALHQGGKEFERDRTDPKGPLLKNRALRMAATVPTWLGISMAIGNATRMPGYTAASPGLGDKRDAVDPISEGISRYFLGRTGSLLPYDEFVQERPDVSRSEYEQYKAYLFGNSMPLKATLDGIHGPEVTFMGKSIPVATGLLPAVAAAVGAAYGTRRAGMRLREGMTAKGSSVLGEGGQYGFKALREAESKIDDVYTAMGRARGDRDGGAAQMAELEGRMEAAKRKRDEVQKLNDLEIFKQAGGISTLAMAGTGVVGQLLESIRRSAKGLAPQEPELGQSEAALPS